MISDKSTGFKISINISNSVKFMILTLLLLTPLFTFNEVRFLILKSVNQSVPLAYIKVIKDILIALLIIASGILILKTRKVNSFAIYYFWLISYIAILFFISLGSNPYMAFGGLRWIVPVILPFFLIDFVEEPLLEKIAKILAGLFVAHFIMQIYELFYMKKVYTITYWGLAGRVPGIFSNPNTAGFFAIITLYFSYMYLRNRKLRYLVYILMPISIYLTSSGTALTVYIMFILLIILGKKYIKILIFTAPVFGYLVLKVISLLLQNRDPRLIYNSIRGRLDVLTALLHHAEWVPTNFGYTTNTANLFFVNADIRDLTIAADSTYTSIIGNMGIIGLMIFILLYLFWVLIAIKVNRLDMYLFTMIFTLYGISMIITEAFPMNLLFAVLIAYFLKSVFRPLAPLITN